jgi:hypothetical protein
LNYAPAGRKVLCTIEQSGCGLLIGAKKAKPSGNKKGRKKAATRAASLIGSPPSADQT